MPSSHDQYKTLDQKPYESLYLYEEAIIDSPVEKVWPHVLNIGSWMNAHRLETIAGKSGQVGHFETVHPKGIGPEVPQPHYHLYGVAEIIPFKLVALEVFPEKGGSYGTTREWMSFDNILLTELGGKTKITFLMVDAHLGKGEKDFHQRRKSELEHGRQLIASYFENLRQLAKKGN